MVIAGIMLMCAFSCAQTPEPEEFHVTIENLDADVNVN